MLIFFYYIKFKAYINFYKLSFIYLQLTIINQKLAAK